MYRYISYLCIAINFMSLAFDAKASYVIHVVGGYDSEGYMVDAGEPGMSNYTGTGETGGKAEAIALDSGAIAYGGVGGNGLSGGIGGFATAYSRSSNAFTLARGGTGGYGYNSASIASGIGGIGGTAKATATATATGYGSAEARQIGGYGGNAETIGGDGANSSMLQAVSGGASFLSLTQTSVGGDGGLGGNGGSGGEAISSLNTFNSSGDDMYVEVNALGGKGGDGYRIAGKGGDAKAQGVVSDFGNVFLNLNAQGGGGGNSDSFPSNGGSAIVDGYASSSGGGDVWVYGTAASGAAGMTLDNGITSDIGAKGGSSSISLFDALDAKTTGAMVLQQEAITRTGGNFTHSSLKKDTESTSLVVFSQALFGGDAVDKGQQSSAWASAEAINNTGIARAVSETGTCVTFDFEKCYERSIEFISRAAAQGVKQAEAVALGASFGTGYAFADASTKATSVDRTWGRAYATREMSDLQTKSSSAVASVYTGERENNFLGSVLGGSRKNYDAENDGDTKAILNLDPNYPYGGPDFFNGGKVLAQGFLAVGNSNEKYSTANIDISYDLDKLGLTFNPAKPEENQFLYLAFENPSANVTTSNLFDVSGINLKITLNGWEILSKTTSNLSEFESYLSGTVINLGEMWGGGTMPTRDANGIITGYGSTGKTISNLDFGIQLSMKAYNSSALSSLDFGFLLGLKKLDASVAPMKLPLDSDAIIYSTDNGSFRFTREGLPLNGIPQVVPIPAAFWHFGSALLLLVFFGGMQSRTS